jgi:hypothetical protein
MDSSYNQWLKHKLPDEKLGKILEAESGPYYGAYNIEGKLIVPFIYDHLEASCDNIIYGIKNGTYNDKYGIMDLKGNILTKPLFDMPPLFNHYGYGLANYGFRIDENNPSASTVNNPNVLWGEIDTKGKIVVPINHHSISWDLEEGIAPVKINGLFGYINLKDSLEIKPQFEEAGSFNFGYAIVKNDSKAGLINKKGEYVIKNKYDDIEQIYLSGNDCEFEDPMFIESSRNGRKDIILVSHFRSTDNGLSLLLQTYRKAASPKRLFLVRNNGKMGLIDINGVEYFD